MKLTEVGTRVRQRRVALGLSQGRLASMAGLSRATINQLENGSLQDLGYAKLATLLDLIGLRLNASAQPPRRGLLMSSRTASVSYAKPLDPAVLLRALASGKLTDDVVPHVATLLDEAPLSLLVSAVEEAARKENVPARRIWQNVESWAAQLRSPRPVWS